VGLDDYQRFYRIKVTEPGTWPNTAAPEYSLPAHLRLVVDAWIAGEDTTFALFITGGSAVDRESVGISVVKQMRETIQPPISGYLWSEFDFCENHRMLRSLEDFAKKERDPETWNLYVEYERKFHLLMARELVYFQSLSEFGTLSRYSREYLYNELIRRITRNQYDVDRYTILSAPSLKNFKQNYQTFYEFACRYATVVSLDGTDDHGL
jgi:hypothetical protein